MAGFLNVYTISIFVALGGSLFGFDIASISGVVGTEQYMKFYGNPLGVTQGAITSSMAVGSVVGALSSSFVGDKFSRKQSIQAGTVLWCIGATIQATSNGVPMLIAGRAIAGLCIGLTSALYYIEYACSFINSEVAFRIPWALQIVPAIILLIGLFWFPYSPRWLGSVDRWDEALRVIAFLRTSNKDTNDPRVLAEFREIEEQIRSEYEESSNSYRELFSKKIRQRLFLSMAVQVWSQLAGMNVMMYYTVYVLQSAGIAHARLLVSFQFVVDVIMTIPCLLWTDKWGRRPSLMVGSIFMALWFYIIGGLLVRYGQPNPVTNQPYTWIIVGHRAASGTILAWWAPISWLYPTEVAPVRVRAKSVALATAANWAANFALGFAVPPMLRSISWRMFFIFGSFNIAAFIHVLFALPDTKQRTLEEMDEIFEHGQPLWKTFVAKGGTDRLDKLAKEIEMGTVDAAQPGLITPGSFFSCCPSMFGNK
ncbi:general substrate transporter [Lipomyces kononenkoae]|uniref:General substrate transporter n=1 Tax=Lipomyces kononenkoae TaxID=34357 RepID=A0ACC3SRI3_LIPKO